MADLGVRASMLHALRVQLGKIGIRLWRAYLGFGNHDGSLVAAGIAYYVALSFFPLMSVLLAVVSFATKATTRGQDMKNEIFEAIAGQFSKDLADQIRRAYEATEATAYQNGTIGAVLLVITAVAIFVQIDYAFDRIWHLGTVRQETWPQWFKRHVIARFKALVMLLSVGGFLLTALIISTIWSGVRAYLAEHNVEPTVSRLTGIAINVALNYFVLAIMYRYVPKPHIKWREAFAAGLVAAPLWEIGRQVLAMYLLRLNYPTTYGLIGSFMAIMLWAYYAMLVVLFGAEYVRVRQHEREIETVRS
jgi:membrane protein